MGRQHRWLFLLQAVSFAMVVFSMVGFALGDMRMLLFVIPVSLYVISLAVGFATSVLTKRTDRVDHEMRVAAYEPDSYPSVDVYLPTAGEPLGVLDNTYGYVAALQWQGELAVYVLDDADRAEVRELATAFGFHYLVRPNRGEFNKAGNLRYGFERSLGDFIVILDADFVPRTDFISELMPYMQDPEIGIVQSPQFFDTTKRMGWLERTAGSTQELFYRWIQPSRDRVNAAICVGSCALYRRSALEAAGGFAQIEHSEDVFTGVNLMRAGYLNRYVPIIVSKGLCPDTVRGFLNQQYRWCTGSMALLADPEFRSMPEISRWQRACFWAGFLYYISTALNAVIAPLSGLAMLWLLPDRVRPFNSVYLVGAGLLYFFVLPLISRSRWRVEVLRVQLLYSFAHLVSIIDVMRGQSLHWVATGDADHRTTPIPVIVGRVMKVWVAATQTAIWTGVALDVAHYGLGRFWTMVALAAFASYIEVPLLFVRIVAPAQHAVSPSNAVPAGILASQVAA